MKRTVLAFVAGVVLTASHVAPAADIGDPALSGFPRYTAQSRIILSNHKCMEDEYLVIPARRVNDNVRYNTPIGPFCAHPDNIRKAPLDND